MLCVVDGFHRLEVARRSGADSIKARVAPMALREALAVARLANAEHDWGKKRTRADMQNVWDSFIASGEHLDAHGATKGAGAIRAEIGCYSRESIRLKLKNAGIPLNNDADYPHGYKPYRGSDDGDDGEDIDDLATGGIRPLDAEYGVEVRAHVEAVESPYFGLGERGRGEALGAVRELLGRLEANVAPVACEPPKPVLMDI
jgi:hypothetical protein